MDPVLAGVVEVDGLLLAVVLGLGADELGVLPVD